MYTDLKDKLTKKYYREIVEKALLQAKEEYEQSPDTSLNISFYNQLLDIKKTVIDNNEIYTKEEAYQKIFNGSNDSKKFLSRRIQYRLCQYVKRHSLGDIIISHDG